ncbi:MAG: RpiB/LacA/LacB family sugar-phosphate isomerase [Candidatus Latescibacteria bacterium]|nr:RpiB/LacA/LacB family sugar-phosphate isomerase [Candidatus Latescibacterota bacterium]
MDQKTVETIVQEVIRRLQIASAPHKVSSTLHKPLIVEADILHTLASGVKTLRIHPRAILTPLAIDTARAKGVILERVDDSSPGINLNVTPSEMIALGSDHDGYALKEVIKAFLVSEGRGIRDLGSDDSRDTACRVAKEVATGRSGWGILVDGMGILQPVVANRVSGIVAVTCHDCFTALVARSQFGANLLCLGGNVVGQQLAVEIVKTWLGRNAVCQTGSHPVGSLQPECHILIDHLDCL